MPKSIQVFEGDGSIPKIPKPDGLRWVNKELGWWSGSYTGLGAVLLDREDTKDGKWNCQIRKAGNVKHFVIAEGFDTPEDAEQVLIRACLEWEEELYIDPDPLDEKSPLEYAKATLGRNSLANK